jgi:CRP-like cAMP-binding protein
MAMPKSRSRLHPDAGAVDIARTRLAATGWLAQTDPAFSHALLALCRWRLVADGEVLSHPDQEEHAIFGVGAGHAVGDLHPLGSLDYGLAAVWHVGSWVGHAPLIMGWARRGVVRARGEVLVAIAPGSALHALLDANPGWWREIAKLPFLFSQIHAGAGQDLLRRDATERCLAVLLLLAGCRWADPPKDQSCVAPITQQELGERCNLSRNGVIKVLKPLAADGLITLGYREIQILDGTALRARLG